jgi:Carboxypeptidase regulatory-like domain
MHFLKKVSMWLVSLSIFMVHGWMIAQSTAGQINGTVSDASGGVIPNASVTLTNQNTNVVTHATTNQSGFFVFLNVQPGLYTMHFSAPNYKTIELPSFNLVVSQILTENETLTIGDATETVNVSAGTEGVMLQRSSSDLGNVIEAREIQQLPLNGRNFTSLLVLSPGVSAVSTAQGSGISTTDAGISAIPGTSFYKPSFFGQQNRETFYLMDGVVNTDIRGAVYGFLPIIDAMDEFKIQSHIDSAEFGVVTGGVINMVSKSGTNHFHGTAWEFNRNNAFDARNTFSDLNGTTPTAPGHYVQNEFGASIGGPIWKDKLFFEGAYEGWRYTKPTLSHTLVPTSQELAGDFSDKTWSYYQQSIYNPYSTTCTGGKCTVQPFRCDANGNPITPVNNIQTGGTPCLKIPSSMINPVMQAYLKAYYRQANSLTNEASGYNYIENGAQVDTNNGYQVRIDINKSAKNYGFGRVSQMWVRDTSPVTGTISSNVNTYHAYNFGGGYTHVFTPNLLLDIRGGAMLKPYVFNQAQAPNGFTDATSAGFQNLQQYDGMYINLASPYSTSNGGTRGLSYRGNPVVNGGGSISWVRGNHTMKAGMDYIYTNRLQRDTYQQFTFSDSITSNINASKTGNSLAGAILGFPSAFTAHSPDNAEDYFSMGLWAGYAQDSWKVTPKLTINIGLRYEYVPAIHMLDHRLANGLDIPNQKYIISASSVAACSTPFVNPCIPGGLSSVSHSNNIVFANNTQQVGPPIKDNWAPRFGFAYQTSSKTVVNGGVGLFYDTITARSQWVQNNIEGPTWPWTTGISAQQENFTQNNVWPGGPGNPLVAITSLEGGSTTPVVASNPWLTTGGGYVTQPGYKDQRSLEWNVQVQEQLAETTLLTLGYAGSKSTRLDFTGYANAAQHASPAGTAAATIDSLKYMPWMAPGWHYSTDTGYSNYNALLVSVQKRFSNSWNTIFSYTWAKSLDNSSGWFNAENGTGGGSVVQNFFDPHNAYGVSSYDIRNTVSWSTLYALPFGKGQRWLQSGLSSYVLGGWRVNYLFQAHSGQPYNLSVGGDPANISGNNGSVTGYSRPNLVGDPSQGSCGATPIGKRGPSGFCMFNSAAFSIPSGSFGNVGKMVYTAPYYNNMDLSLIKDTTLHENINLEIRAEAFNIYNAMIIGNPGTTIGNSSAGLATNIGNTPRELQLGAKVTF